MRTALNNPFEPGSDRIPQVWAGRQPQLADWRDRVRPRRAVGQYERGRTLLGEPGIGKSVLVRRLVTDAVRDGDWGTGQVRVPRGVNPLPLLAEALLTLADAAGLPARREERIGALLRRVTSISVWGAGVELDPTEAGEPPHAALAHLLIEVGRSAMAADRVVIVHVDEVQNVDDDAALSQLLVALGDALAHEDERTVPGGTLDVVLPIAVYLTGLPEFADIASSRAGATFARRFATELLEPLSDEDLRAALGVFVRDGWPAATPEGPRSVHMEPAAAEAIVGLCHGDPFLFQLAGQHAWDAGPGERVTHAEVLRGWDSARTEARRHVERLLERLPAAERALLDAMAELDPQDRTLTQIARTMGYERASQVGPTAQRLDTVRGLIVRGKRYRFRARAVEALLTSSWPDVGAAQG